MVVKAELHCHIEGAARPALVRSRAAAYGVDVSAIISGDSYVWSDFTSFLRAYDLASKLFRTEEDYALLSETYLRELASQGAIYSEFFISTDHAIGAGLTPEAYIAGLAEGMRRAREATGIEARMIATGLRHEGPEGVERAARYIAENPHPLVTGFGMAGDERMGVPADFAKAFDIARDAGLSITVHAGELGGAESVRGALDDLKPSRIGHGVRAVEDPALVFSEGAVLLRPGATSRAGEAAALAPSLRAHFDTVIELPGPGFADGGDILTMPGEVMIGLSARTDRAGAEALTACLKRLGRKAQIVETPQGVLHFKTDCSLLDGETILATARLAKSGAFERYQTVIVPEGEEAAANALRVNDAVFVGADFPRTIDRLDSLGFRVVPLATGKIGKIDAGLSCMSLRWRSA